MTCSSLGPLQPLQAVQWTSQMLHTAQFGLGSSYCSSWSVHPVRKTLTKSLEVLCLARNGRVLRLMGSNKSSADGHPESVLVEIIGSFLATGETERSVAVVTSQSEDGSPPSVTVPGLPERWSKHVVNWDEMATQTKSLLNSGNNVLMIPPWGRRSTVAGEQEGEERRLLSYSTASRALLEVQEEILLHCPAPDVDAVLCVLLPASTVRSERSRLFRSDLMANWQVTHAVYMRGVFPNVHTSFEGVLLCLVPKGHADPLVRFFEVGKAEDTGAADVLADFNRLQRMKGSTTEFGYVFRGDLEAGDSLAYGLRDPKIEAKRQDLAHFGYTAPLEELFEIRRGKFHPVAHRGQLCEANALGAARVLAGRDLTLDGTITDADAEATWMLSEEPDLLRANDFLIPVISVKSDKRGFKVAKFCGTYPATWNSNVLVLRPLESVPTEVIDFAVAYLRSSAATQLHSAYNSTFHLGREIGALTVPIPDEEILAALRNLREAQNNFLEWADEAGRVIDSIFDYPSVKEARPKIIEAGRFVRWRNREAANLDDPDFVVRRAFPYPIAHRWRVMEASLSGGPPGSGYTSILDTAESVLTFLAQVVLVLARAAGIEVRAVEAIQRKLGGGSGPGMGDWAAVLQETSGKHFAVGVTQSGLANIIGMFRTADVEAARVRLSNRRNDEAHNRRVEPADLAEAIDSALTDLRILTLAAAFLVDMPLRHVTAATWDSFASVATVTYREMIGDHWVVKSETDQVSANDIETDSLYILDPDGKWHLLRPFVVVRHCPQCRTISTFHVDACINGTVRLKSIENGHTVMDEQEVPALKKVGLL
jgi:hypothetical protein